MIKGRNDEPARAMVATLYANGEELAGGDLTRYVYNKGLLSEYGILVLHLYAFGGGVSIHLDDASLARLREIVNAEPREI